MEKSQYDADRHRGSRPLVLLADIAKLQLNRFKKRTKEDAEDHIKAVQEGVDAANRARAKVRVQIAKQMQKKQNKKPKINVNVIKAKASQRLMADELTTLMKDVNSLLRKERKNLPQWIRKYKDEDPRCVFYHSMLRRIGLPERHARFAPWFLKSDQLVLNVYAQKIFQRFEDAYLAQCVRLSETEAAVKSHEEFVSRIATMELDPREKNQMFLQRVFRDCTFVQPKLRLSDRKGEPHPLLLESPSDVRDENEEPLAAIADKDNLEDPTVKHIAIPEVKMTAAPPGLAPAVPGKLESHGKHVYHAYNGRWKDGEMRGAVGVYQYADGGKYTGAWKDSVQCGIGTAEYPNGVTYQGHWKDGKFHGHGIWESSSGMKYEGMWRDGMRHGKGMLKMASGAVYEGDFYRNQRHGQGIESSPYETILMSASNEIQRLGYKYKGNFRMNRIFGPGQIEIEMDDGKFHIYAKDHWEQCVLGEAAMEAKTHWLGVDSAEEVHMRRLLRIRDDLRADDLQENFHIAEEKRLIEEEKMRKKALREANKEKRDALAKAKEAFQSRLLEQNEESDAGATDGKKPNFFMGDNGDVKESSQDDDSENDNSDDSEEPSKKEEEEENDDDNDTK